jgi:hypothetical protein
MEDMAMITEVRSPAEWRGGEIADEPEWRIPLGDRHRAEVLAAVHAVDVAGLSPADLARADFPLPTLGSVLSDLTTELLDGRGFVLLQGLPIEGLSQRQTDVLAVGIGSHVGAVAPQGPDGVPLVHVRDVGVDPSDPTRRSYQHSGRLGYHADPHDFVALLCLRPAKSGGLSSIVSSVAVHNEIVRTAPELADVLYQPWWRDSRTGDGPDSFYQQPVYALGDDGRMVAAYGPDYMLSALRGAHVPPLSARQVAAMDAMDRLNNDPRLVLSMDLRPGDMQFLNNHVVMHSRTEYEDHPEPERRRDLVRLWLDADQTRQRPIQASTT